MTLVAGRMPSLHSFGEDVNKQGILKSGHARRPNRQEVDLYFDKPAENNLRQDDGKRLVRFCEEEDSEKDYRSERNSTKGSSQDVFKLGSNMYVINSSDPNSAVRKLFPNSKLTPINPFVNRSVNKDRTINQSLMANTKENNHNSFNGAKAKYNSEVLANRNIADRKTDRGTLRRNLQKVQPEARLKSGKVNNPATPLIERIKQLTCESDELVRKEHSNLNTSRKPTELSNNQEEKPYILPQTTATDLPKQSTDSVNLVQYNQNISHSRSHHIPETKCSSLNKTDEARRSFLSSLAQQNEGVAGDRSSVATNSTTADTVYSLSDIEEVLTEEEKEIKEAFSQEIKQDELELFVQQDAGRTERLRKRYSSTPKPDSQSPKTYSNNNYSFVKNQNQTASYFTNDNCNIKKDKPKFGSTIEILQQLQQQIETPYQLEGRRTACSNYSDSSIPISERLFCDESSDGYEPILPKQQVHRTCSLDSKNYEEIDNFPSAFSVPRTKSQEHPRLTQPELDPYVYASSSVRYSGSYIPRNQPFEQSIYASSPDLHGYRQSMFPDRVSSYNNHPFVGRQLHPVLQRRYCRYPLSEAYSSPVDEGKVLTPPVRMHTYMNVPHNAPCYTAPPPYSQINNYIRPPPYSDIYHCEFPHAEPHTIYQNVPFSTNPNVMTLRRLCTERERGVPEGASSSQDSKEIYPTILKDVYSSANHLPISKPSSLPHHYCVDV